MRYVYSGKTFYDSRSKVKYEKVGFWNLTLIKFLMLAVIFSAIVAMGWNNYPY